MRLLARLGGLDDVQARSPSLLPEWTVGHVLTHLARNADALASVLAAAERGETVPMYPSMASRFVAIEMGSSRSAAELVDDVGASIERLESCLATMTGRGWAGAGVAAFGPLPVAEVPWRRWREVEVHGSDLGPHVEWASTHGDWPADFVRFELVRMQMVWASRRPMGLTALPELALAAAPNDRLAWLFGRRTIDGLAAAGIF